MVGKALAKRSLALNWPWPFCALKISIHLAVTVILAGIWRTLNKKKTEELKFYGEDKRGKKVYLYLRGDHPDFIYLAPEKAEIKIDQIRGVKDFAYLTPALSKRKVIFIEPAEAMNPYAQNALLKVLEEPPEDTHFILITSLFLLKRVESVTLIPQDLRNKKASS